MKRKTVIAVSAACILLLIISIWLGRLATKPIVTENRAVQHPAPTEDINIEETISDSDAEEQSGKYKIILSGSTLRLYNEDELLNETEIAPDVLPRADIKALSAGIEYYTIEEALVDWESLCK